ncbi:zf-HC2 domain-containing protein [Eikenella sp. S3360]|uniref:Zf-HC2 domain-containing protein n=1 Tax=Eikenella glucosivorans TaxID=2766967 RepID=A0ABS0NDK8_9NEIS|nr:zf-HC2 domain-containing protein [Eikenella glucosivorans]MBH5330350.1 zf-HC2 domain-containing protein [Eikenella glucosivorans]
MLKCKRAAELMSLQQDRPLTLPERWQLRLHLLACSPCSRYRQQMETINRAMEQIRQEQTGKIK